MPQQVQINFSIHIKKYPFGCFFQFGLNAASTSRLIKASLMENKETPVIGRFFYFPLVGAIGFEPTTT